MKVESDRSLCSRPALSVYQFVIAVGWPGRYIGLVV